MEAKVAKGENLDKLRSIQLQELVQDAHEQTTSVLIQLNLPERKIGFKTLSMRGRNVRMAEYSATSADGSEACIKNMQAFLEHLLARSPVWLASAQSFVAEVTPLQLREVAAHPSVKAIWLNRDLDVNH